MLLKYMQYQATPTWWQDRNIHLNQLLLHHDHAGPGGKKTKQKKTYWEAFSALKLKYSRLGLFSCASRTEAFFGGERMLSSRPNFLRLSLKIEEANESCSDVMGLFNSKGGSEVF